jgi:hypothetical protein
VSNGDKILSNFPPEALKLEQTHGAFHPGKFVSVTLLNNSYITQGRAMSQQKYSVHGGSICFSFQQMFSSKRYCLFIQNQLLLSTFSKYCFTFKQIQ